MSAILMPGEAAALPEPWPHVAPDSTAASAKALDSDPSDASLSHNAAWEIDRVEMLERSERRAWRAAWTGLSLAAAGIATVLVQSPLRELVPIPIVVDRLTGETTIQQRLGVETVPALEALDKHNLATFVRAREGYSWMFLQRDFDQVARTATPAVFADYNRQFEGDTALQRRVGATEDWQIHIVSVRLSPTGRSDNRGEATVTYDKTIRMTDRKLPDATTRHIASVVFRYQPKALAKEKDRLENPLGFVVTAYRSDPEINTAGGRS
ncbi:virB8 family protein [Paucibacter sp. M5-1]|uniref:virB8 family protein n=1 Tax=Paucibacter sp. M5-1 TaxID=3015998 RepID=UPI0022B9144F|nr:type IV secretion system protein [Paucibacter sp. M5-1]MCZ7880451.1 type IV secretion system protein [Paucibacter sp. M5-1]